MIRASIAFIENIGTADVRGRRRRACNQRQDDDDKCECLLHRCQRWTLRIQLPSAIPIEQKTIAVTNAMTIPP